MIAIAPYECSGNSHESVFDAEPDMSRADALFSFVPAGDITAKAESITEKTYCGAYRY
jgi:hypothetical protein